MLTIDCYVSLSSPWVYLGCDRLAEIANRHGCSIAIKPTNFAHVFEKTGGLPLGKRAPERQAYRLIELQRWSERLSLPMVLKPAHFPANNTPSVQFMLAALDQGFDGLKLLKEIGRALWERNEDIADESVLAAAAKRAGIDTDVAQTSPELAINKYLELTDEAISRGVFGAPSYVLPTNEIFWGQDRLDLLDWRLASLGKS